MSATSSDLAQRLGKLGSEIGHREAAYADDLERARDVATSLHDEVAGALEVFHRSAASAGAPHIVVVLGPVRTDEKHVRAVEFDLSRGRHRAIVTVKSKGEVTLVGPFHRGKVEGPCRSFPFEAEDDLQAALGDFLGKFLEEAASP